MVGEITYSCTKQELDRKAKEFMLDTYGTAKESEDKDKWYERYGMLLDFISQLYEVKI